ncbi:MAG: stage 0 sporulation family protein [Oscillospiraceae bacterium]|jgi:cell fate regulator YaaT (PSP1 superfamily)|nr:stage 0 sporulation family protein [Oscillospiraceae bacterium]MDD3260554.1 stage 0 sporulation family protein [Oscillospiraceae bacterium]
MAKVIGVRFKNLGKVYYFDPEDQQLQIGNHVIVETARGVECGEVAMPNREIAEDHIVQPLRKIIRVATQKDLDKVKENCEKEISAFEICQKKIAAHQLEMKLVDVEYTFDNNKILFYFTADGRVDFRELVKDLASVFRTRIELRQIGVRDEAKMLGGLGLCGRPFCCSQFLAGFQPVSIKMAKEQGLSLNPVKISGTCGRLMCCLKYEQEAYQDLQRTTPPVGSYVLTPEGRGTVTATSLLTGVLQVHLDSASAEAAPIRCKVKDTKFLRAPVARPRQHTKEKRPEKAAAGGKSDETGSDAVHNRRNK